MALTYRGPVLELQGRQFDPPEGVSGAAAAKWFEEEHAKEQERAARPRKVKITPQPTSMDTERLNALEAEVDDIQARLQEPDVMQLVAALGAFSGINQGAATTAESLNAMLARAVEQKEENERILAEAEAAAAEARQLKAEAMTLIQQNQTLVAGAFNSFAKQLAGFRKDLAEADGELGIIRSQTKDLARSVESAADINETAISVGREAAADAVNEGMEQFAAFAGLVVRSLGLTESDLNAKLNAGYVTASEHFITRAYLSKAAEIFRSWENTPGALADVVAAEEAISPNPGPQLEG